jgi:hypothetical protein
VISCFLHPNVQGIRLICDYDKSDKKCNVNSVDLSNIFREEIFEIFATAEEMSETIAINFELSPNVDFIPPAVVDQLPNLIGLEVFWSIVPIIKNDLFSSRFGKIKRLWFTWSAIEFIEEKAFQHLKNLEELNLFNNKIKSLSSTLFSNNPKLKIIDLSENEIIVIHPKLFESLSQLKNIKLKGKNCVDDKFGCEDCTDVIDHEELDRELSACYSNCFFDNECGKNLNSSVEFQCEFTEGLFEITEVFKIMRF